MAEFPQIFPDEASLEEALSRPAEALIQCMGSLKGDLIFLGVSGKMGISMACMARRACEAAGVEKRIIGVSRFSQPENKAYLNDRGVETLAGDLLETSFLNQLPEVDHVIYLAGTKFGTQGNEAYTWAMNAYLPGLVAERFKDARIVALSTGCVYPLVPVESGGSLESDVPCPIGEYAQSCLGRERLFQYASQKYGNPLALIRLNYAVEMRYGVVVDIAHKVFTGEPIDLGMGYLNCIWQGDANALVLRSLVLAESGGRPINLTGPETLSVRKIAEVFGEAFGREPVFQGKENPDALLSNASLVLNYLGKPQVSSEQVLHWTADWIASRKPILGKPTHFETRDGNF